MTTGKFAMTMLPIVLIGILQYSCTPSVSGVETTNGFTVVATCGTIEGTAPPYAQVFLFDTAYIPYLDRGFGFGTSVDIDGAYSFSVAPGTYNILVIDREGSQAGLLQKTVASETLPDKESEVPEKNLLTETGTVSGTVAAESGTTLLVYLAGTGYYRLLTGTTPFTLYSVPSGPALLCCAILSTGERVSSTVEVVKNLPIEVTPGSVTKIGTVTLD